MEGNREWIRTDRSLDWTTQRRSEDPEDSGLTRGPVRPVGWPQGKK